MRKTNTLEIIIDVRKSQFDIEAKHQIAPTAIIEIVSTLMAEYKFLLLSNSKNVDEIDNILADIDKVVDILESKGRVALKIFEYQVNTFGVGNQVIYEIDKVKNIDLLEVICALIIISAFMKDTLIESYGIEEKIYELDEVKGTEILAKFRETIEILSGCADIKGVTNAVYRNSIVSVEDRIDVLSSDIDFVSSMSKEVLDSIYDEEIHKEFIKLEKERYQRLVEYVEHRDDCGCEHNHEHHHHENCSCSAHHNTENNKFKN